MRKIATYLSIILLWVSVVSAQVLGEEMKFTFNELDGNTWKHSAREFSFATISAGVQYGINGEVNMWLTRGLNFVGGVAYEFGQGKIEGIDILANIVGTELALLPWRFIKKRKKKKYEFQVFDERWRIEIEQIEDN